MLPPFGDEIGNQQVRPRGCHVRVHHVCPRVCLMDAPTGGPRRRSKCDTGFLFDVLFQSSCGGRLLVRTFTGGCTIVCTRRSPRRRPTHDPSLKRRAGRHGLQLRNVRRSTTSLIVLPTTLLVFNTNCLLICYILRSIVSQTTLSSRELDRALMSSLRQRRRAHPPTYLRAPCLQRSIKSDDARKAPVRSLRGDRSR